jgi:Xaa-Pro dipeptidase
MTASMEPYSSRIDRFAADLAAEGELAFLPVSADAQYLTGVPRPMPNFGATLHPGDWAEGIWLAPGHRPAFVVTRMSSELGGQMGSSLCSVRQLADNEDPESVVDRLLSEFGVSERARVLVGDQTAGKTISRLQALRPGATFVSATRLLMAQRRIKGPSEIDALRQAGELTEAVMGAVLARLRHGMTELDVISEVDHQLRRRGSLGSSFTTMVYCSGPRHPLLLGTPLESQPRPLLPPVSVLFDFGAIVSGYCYDYGRTVCFGEPTGDQRRVHQLVMGAQAAGIAALVPGTTGSQADRAARKVIDDAGYGPAFRHRLGHGIGLDVHEPPFLAAGEETPLEAGMTFTVEPSILQDAGFSARVEDIVVVGDGGGVPLTSGQRSLLVVD